MAANPRFAGARPHDVRIRGSDRERADRLHRLIVEDLLPVHAAVDRFRHTARRASGVIHEGVAGDAGDWGQPIAFGSDAPPSQLTVHAGSQPRWLTLRGK